MRMHTFALLVSAFSFCSVAAEGSPKVVDLGYIKVQSDLSLVEGVTSFLGVRYAKAPTGDLRWRAPHAPDTIEGTYNATTMPKQCWQASITGSAGLSPTNPFRATKVKKPKKFKKRYSRIRSPRRIKAVKTRDTANVSDEDCLFLNVHVPTKSANLSLLPVIVYMHGGGYDAGNVSLYPVEDFVRSTGFEVVSVSIQYRLGLFGFLAGKEVHRGGDLNAGLLDQHFALQWVRKHISAFGGDKDKVTIWGQSAGAGSILQHVVAHRGQTKPPLFRAVLMNSPFLPFQYNYDDAIPERLFSQVVTQSGCISSHKAPYLECLRTKDAASLLEIDTVLGESNFLGSYTFVPVVGGSFIVESPTTTLLRKQVNGEALLVSTNTNEGTFFVPGDVLTSNNFTLEEYTTQLFPRLGEADIKRAAKIYLAAGAGSVPEQASLVMGDCGYTNYRDYHFVLILPAIFVALRTTLWRRLVTKDLSFALPPGFNNSDFLNAFQQSFLSTALSLNPISGRTQPTITPSKWSPWAHEYTEMLFNKTEADLPVIRSVSTNQSVLDRCAFWNSVASINNQ
ncbi:hypothetical protein HGRIS_010267 [Hohenbuehelia grisea]|uniref:Carboxylic ester hydrolase n=1 Tax=Hohenbuehelia grisea TaxID=104357 RepID=A0ABR3J468_9AGAR